MDPELSVEQQWDAYLQDNPSDAADAQPNAEALPGDVPSEDGTPANERKPAPSPTEIELLKAELAQLRQEQQAEREALRQEMARTKQSFRDSGNSIVERVTEQLEQAMLGINAAVQNGMLTQEDANALETGLRRNLERQQVNFARQAAFMAQNQQGAQAEPSKPAWMSGAEKQMAAILTASKLAATDPEFATLPTQITHEDPFEAVRMYRTLVEAAMQKKAARLGRNGNGNGQRPDRPPVLVDMGSGASASLRSEATVTAALEAEMKKDAPDWERVRQLSADLERFIPQR